jgi:hypothetical protein
MGHRWPEWFVVRALASLFCSQSNSIFPWSSFSLARVLLCALLVSRDWCLHGPPEFEHQLKLEPKPQQASAWNITPGGMWGWVLQFWEWERSRWTVHSSRGRCQSVWYIY